MYVAFESFLKFQVFIFGFRNSFSHKMDVALECTSTRIRIFFKSHIFFYTNKSFGCSHVRHHKVMRTHLNRPFLKPFSSRAVYHGFKAQSTQTRETKRAVSYGNKRTGPKMLGKNAWTTNKRQRTDVGVATVMRKNEQMCKSLYFTGFFNT